MDLNHRETLAVMAGLNRLSDAIAADGSSAAVRMREAIESARAKLIEHRNIDVEWRS